jgi:hypothetical protein
MVDIVTTTNGLYPWSFVKHIFRNDDYRNTSQEIASF